MYHEFRNTLYSLSHAKYHIYITILFLKKFNGMGRINYGLLWLGEVFHYSGVYFSLASAKTHFTVYISKQISSIKKIKELIRDIFTVLTNGFLIGYYKSYLKLKEKYELVRNFRLYIYAIYIYIYICYIYIYIYSTYKWQSIHCIKI